jgi:hypothetical protein
MSNLNSRLHRLENQHPAQVHKYLCVYYADKELDGYKVTRTDPPGGDLLHFATMEELQAFEARPDVDLLIFQILYASEARP